MPGPAPKPSSLRQRRNKTTTAASLPSAEASAALPVPDLPPRGPWSLKATPAEYLDRWPTGPNASLARQILDGEVEGPWHPLVLEWWEAVWRSPMAPEFLDADMRGGLNVLVGLYQDYHTATSRTARKEAATEIRLQEARFGLDPISRRRLQWEVARGEAAEKKRSSGKAPKRDHNDDGDPRRVALVP